MLSWESLILIKPRSIKPHERVLNSDSEPNYIAYNRGCHGSPRPDSQAAQITVIAMCLNTLLAHLLSLCWISCYNTCGQIGLCGVPGVKRVQPKQNTTNTNSNIVDK